MKINAAFSNLEEFRYLLSHGADEVYCGLLTDLEKEGITNHRPNLPGMNLRNMDELKEAIDIVHKDKKKISFVINEAGYPDLFLDGIIKKLKMIDSMGIDAFVISDVNLMNLVKDRINAKIFLSSIAPVFNIETYKFYKQFGISRVILSQHLYPAEYAEMKKDMDIETEVFFFKTNYCRCIDGHCFYTYNPQIWKDKIPLDACDHIKTVTKYSNGKKKGLKDNIKSFYNYHYPFGMDAYGAIYDFHKLGVEVIKLGNREASFNIKKKCIKMTAYMVKLLEKEISRKKFILSCRLKSASLFYQNGKSNFSIRTEKD